MNNEPSKQTIPKNKQGSILIGVIVLLFIVAGIAAVSIQNALNTTQLANHMYRLELAQYSAEAGFHEAARIIDTGNYIASNTVVNYSLPHSGDARVIIRPLTIESDRFEIESWGTYHDKNRGVLVNEVYNPKLSDYALFMEDYGEAFFQWGQTTDGKVFIGSAFRVAGYLDDAGVAQGPIFTDKVEIKTARDEVINRETPEADEGSRDIDYATFNGLEFDVTEVPTLEEAFDSSFTRARTAAHAQDQNTSGLPPGYVIPVGVTADYHGYSIYFEGPTEVRFYMKQNPSTGVMEGYVAFSNETKFADTAFHERPQQGLDLVVVDDGGLGDGTLTTGEHENDLDLRTSPPGVDGWQGYVTDDITFYTEDDITIKSHLRYWDDVEGADYDSSNDKLLFVSGDDIWIDPSWRSNWNGFTLQAGLIASGAKYPIDSTNGDADGKIGVQGANNTGLGSLGVLDFLGNYIGQVYAYSGLFSESGALAGLRPDRRMDYRFINDPPPFAPILDATLKADGWHIIDEPTDEDV